MKGNTPLEVMAAIVKNDGSITAYISHDAKEWVIGIVTGVTMREPRSFCTDYDDYAYCSLTNPLVKKARPMTKRELSLWLIEHPTYAIRHDDWDDEDWEVESRWAESMNDNIEEWQYADLKDPCFPRWKPIPEVEDEK
jgi:hypothetical protein